MKEPLERLVETLDLAEKNVTDPTSELSHIEAITVAMDEAIEAHPNLPSDSQKNFLLLEIGSQIAHAWAVLENDDTIGTPDFPIL